jgi:2-(1,2-epoxy-1,2-dihydrophenyl)acetyl-CoA isomerase
MKGSSEAPHALYETRDGIATITLNRPEVRNTHSAEMTSALLQATFDAERDESVRCIVIRGAGSCFAAGGDIPQYNAAICENPEGHRTNLDGQIGNWHLIVSRLRAMPKPVLASIHGSSFGYGLSLVLASDLAIASSDASFMIPHRHVAMTPDAGLSYLLPRLIGERRALELVLLGEPIDATTAREMGIINWVTTPEELEERTAKLARKLSIGPPLALAYAKTLLRGSIDSDWESQIARERETARLAIRTSDHVEGVASFVEKRRPAYSGS